MAQVSTARRRRRRKRRSCDWGCGSGYLKPPESVRQGQAVSPEMPEPGAVSIKPPARNCGDVPSSPVSPSVIEPPTTNDKSINKVTAFCLEMGFFAFFAGSRVSDGDFPSPLDDDETSAIAWCKLSMASRSCRTTCSHADASWGL